MDSRARPEALIGRTERIRLSLDHKFLTGGANLKIQWLCECLSTCFSLPISRVMKLSVSTYRAISASSRTTSNLQQRRMSLSQPSATTTAMSDPSGHQTEHVPGSERQASVGGDEKSRAANISVQVEDCSSSQMSERPTTISITEDDSETDNFLKSSTTENVSSDRNHLQSPSGPLKSNQRWMKLRTTVHLTGALTSAAKPKPALKREDSFLKRFSTRQIVDGQETFDEPYTTDDDEVCDNQKKRPARKRVRPPRTVLNPDQNGYFLWLMAVTLCVLYNLWSLIVRQAFPELQQRASQLWIALDLLSDFVYLLDIGVQIRTGYLEQGIMVYDSAKLARHYIKSRPFVLDLLAVVPLDLLQLLLGARPMLRFPRFIKVYRVRAYYYMVESRTIFPNIWRVANLIHVLLLLAHWFGCFYYLLSEAEQFRGQWAYPYHYHEDFSTLTRKYLGSVYWSTLTLTTIGDLPAPETNSHGGDNTTRDGSGGVPLGAAAHRERRHLLSRLTRLHSNTEFIFTIVSYLIGVFIFATIVGQVGNVITNRNANRLEFERLLDSAKLYMRHHRVPRGMQRRVQRWYDYSWSRGHIQGGGDINAALGLLPDKLRTELALHVNLVTLKKVTIFKACQPEFLHDLVLKMKAYIFTPGDLVCRKGEVAREMFIIADGILEVISESGKVLTAMRSGDFFGEIGILNLDGLNKRTADVRSVGYAELFSLSRENVLSAMRDYPEAQDILQTMGRKRLLEARRASAVARAAKKTVVAASAGEPPLVANACDSRTQSVTRGSSMSDRHNETDHFPGSLASPPSADNTDSSTLNDVASPPLRTSRNSRGSVSRSGHNSGDAEPLGAGLPLIQRLRMLKQKERLTETAKEENRADPGDRSEEPVVGSLSEGSAGDSRFQRNYSPAKDLVNIRTDSSRTNPSTVSVLKLPLVREDSSSEAVDNVLKVRSEHDPNGLILGSRTISSQHCSPSVRITEDSSTLDIAAPSSDIPTRNFKLRVPGTEDEYLWSRQYNQDSGGSDPEASCLDFSESTHRRELRSIMRDIGDAEDPATSAVTCRTGAPSVAARVSGLHNYIERKKKLVKTVSFGGGLLPAALAEVAAAEDQSTVATTAAEATPAPHVTCSTPVPVMLPDVASHLPLTTRADSSDARCTSLMANISNTLQIKLNEIHVSLTSRIESLETQMRERDNFLRNIYYRQRIQQTELENSRWQKQARLEPHPDRAGGMSEPASVELPVSSGGGGSVPAAVERQESGNDWEMQLLVAEMNRTEQREQRRLVPDLSVSEVRLLDRIQHAGTAASPPTPPPRDSQHSPDFKNRRARLTASRACSFRHASRGHVAAAVLRRSSGEERSSRPPRAATQLHVEAAAGTSAGASAAVASKTH